MNDPTLPPGHDLERRFLEMVHANEARLRKICRVYGRAAGAEDDLYQEILVRLWRALPSFNGRSEPGTWLYRVALNTALNWRRQRAARPEESLEQVTERLGTGDVSARGPQPDEQLEARERLRQLYAAIERLDDADKALVLLYLDDRSYGEMAEVLGITESNVGVKLHRIRKQMSAWLNTEST